MNDPDVYMVRVWHGDTGFRASVRRIDEEQTRIFDDAQALTRFLAEPRRDTDPAATTADPEHQGG